MAKFPVSTPAEMARLGHLDIHLFRYIDRWALGVICAPILVLVSLYLLLIPNQFTVRLPSRPRR